MSELSPPPSNISMAQQFQSHGVTAHNKPIGTIVSKNKKQLRSVSRYENQFGLQKESGRMNTLPNPENLQNFIDASRGSIYHSITKQRRRRGQEKYAEGYKLKHFRSQSYQSYRDELERQIKQKQAKAMRLAELKGRKDRLKAKLSQLDFRLKQIKTHAPKLHSSSNQYHIKHPRNLVQSEINIISSHKQSQVHSRLSTDPNEAGSVAGPRQGEEFYEGSPQHRCLECRDFALRKQEVYIPSRMLKALNKRTL